MLLYGLHTSAVLWSKRLSFFDATPLLHSLSLLLFIIGPPKVSASNQTLTIGYGGSISCSISGNVTRIMWYKNGSYIAKWKTGNCYFMCKVECSCQI